MRVALDVMGGDGAPGVNIEGALLAAKEIEKGDAIYLVGPEEIVKNKLSEFKNASKFDNLEIIHAPEVIGMEEPPVEAIKKKRSSSIAVMAKMASKGEVDAIVSAGNTGACVAASQLRMRNLPGVNRPGIAVVFPTKTGPHVVCDVGANVSCKPINIYQYAIMASVYSSQMLGIEKPRVGLLSIGEEESKGNEVTKKTRALLRDDEDLNFIGNIEGRDVFKGVCDVTVCEGFVGNIVLKLTEGLVDHLFGAIRDELKKENMLFALKFKGMMKRFYKKYDYHEYGGALLLGVNGTSVICHGSSVPRSIKNAVLAAERFTNKQINDQIVDWLSSRSVETPQ
ncbi:phosphate acyltransferase PlsX [Sedimentisphaera salicampi]|uniref:Phosphate acyltransferase n=1 Tax=Sedimentisphaera salicampi TaxID=1941349 RepID=A0A1W6LKU6_9BACT|nr:phosphate acyltransferase PlsX [Sedimentisphaera salicampi]ARN56385.1 Phosphate acyltransferase [Sedimentisphaera salicampi]OXU15271.1 Phosphate acyltransferase [Sedimentisphaera salicampi]